MKKLLSILVVTTMTVFLINTSCQNKPNQNSNISREDSLKIKAWNNLFGAQSMDSTSHLLNNTSPLFNRVADSSYAEACMKEYVRLYKYVDIKDTGAIKKAFTDTIGFATNGSGPFGPGIYLIDWINKIPQNSGYTDLLLLFGVYVDPTGFKINDPDEIKYLKSKIGRLTVFLWPRHRINSNLKTINSNMSPLFSPSSPFNFGDLVP